MKKKSTKCSFSIFVQCRISCNRFWGPLYNVSSQRLIHGKICHSYQMYFLRNWFIFYPDSCADEWSQEENKEGKQRGKKASSTCVHLNSKNNQLHIVPPKHRTAAKKDFLSVHCQTGSDAFKKKQHICSSCQTINHHIKRKKLEIANIS